jgi:nicotinamide phosphoribosyltransferase
MRTNLILCSDSYKYCHPFVFGKCENAFYYVEPRGGSYDTAIFFSLQYLLKEYLTKPISQADIDEAEAFCKLHGVPFYREGWQHILDAHNGFLPLRIRAVPEGTPIPVHNVLMTVETTDPKCYWLPGFIETLLLKVWYPTTVASRSRYIKSIILDALNKSSDTPEAEVDFKLHAFGYRGVSSEESAGIGGAAELLCFKGSDTVRGILFAREYYGCEMAGFSIPASEHSVICSFGKDHELDAYKKFLAVYAKPGAIIACVSDTYDLWACIEKYWCGELKQTIIDSGTTLVVRPDSGDPATVVLKTLQMLDAGFGHIVNSKGFRVLNNVRVIQGDGINENSLKEVLDTALAAGYSASNLAFGCGAGMVQKLDRDTMKFAYKLSSITVDGKEQDVCKDPITDPGKKSMAGRLDCIYLPPKSMTAGKTTINIPGSYQTVRLYPGEGPHSMSVMRTVFENGKLLIDDTLDEIRKRAML